MWGILIKVVYDWGIFFWVIFYFESIGLWIKNMFEFICDEEMIFLFKLFMTNDEESIDDWLVS